MQAVTTIGLDIAKSVFQIHGVDAAGNVIVRRQLKRRYVLPFFQKLPPCLVGIEACASSHQVARTAGSWSYGALDAARLREALRQATQK
jgi:transposase